MTRSIDDLLALMRRLRDPERGCPWDREQTFHSLVKHTLEEAYEVADAIEREALPELPDELGDLLFQVVFHAQVGEEAGQFSFGEIVSRLHDKLVRRHPHLFAEAEIQDAAAQALAWERIKAEERATKHARHAVPSELDDLPVALPALTRAAKLQKRASRVGFDWSAPGPVLEKIQEELEELREVVADSTAHAAQEEELGDLIFAVVNLARHLGIDPEAATRAANRKFERRFRYVEEELLRGGKTPAESDLQEMDALWDRAKSQGL
ncbi:MAG: nucleoside triphosphate pyrophosphohydrolase [Gammaproteobacteria bacterium]|nr:nucleoside triphosphate pyrophosphohydrolase [Gammaproteobacteria bacterium]